MKNINWNSLCCLLLFVDFKIQTHNKLFSPCCNSVSPYMYTVKHCKFQKLKPTINYCGRNIRNNLIENWMLWDNAVTLKVPTVYIIENTPTQHTQIHTWTHTNKYTRTHTYKHAHMYTQHTYTHVCIHTYTWDSIPQSYFTWHTINKLFLQQWISHQSYL